MKSVQVQSIQKLNQKMIQILYKRIVQKNLPQSTYSQESFKNNSQKSKIISFQKIVYKFFQDNIVYGRPLKVSNP